MNIYLDMLAYGEKMLDEDKPVKIKDLIGHLESIGHKINSNFRRGVFETYCNFIFHRNTSNLFENQSTGKLYDIALKDEAYITTESYQNLLDYKELEEARNSSKSARNYALWAITLSLIALVVSIIFSVLQLTRPQTIEPNQFQTIQEIKKSLDKSQP